MRPIRVLFGAMDLDFRQKLEFLISSQPDIRVIGVLHSAVTLLLVTGEETPDAVVLALEANGSLPGLCSHLIAEYELLTVVGVSPQRMCVYCSGAGEQCQTAAYEYSDASFLWALRSTTDGLIPS